MNVDVFENEEVVVVIGQGSVILIGMPGAGKSTIGVLLAKETARDFVDTDVLIQLREGKTLQDILDESDYLNLRRIEEEVLLSVDLSHHVIATGGSAVYSAWGMKKLKSLGPVVYLHADLDELRRRIHNFDTRGIASLPGQSLQDLFAEREALYKQYADLIIDCNGKNQEQIITELLAKLTK
ncbi:shikimate kinase [Dasania marina]|uniref:shikimate kinase n=1 Tax=Dasania marina TaxID=471499 RepID=UPI00036D68D5|nr:shikimate kinase [Dasania marina]